uniref:TNFR-Cys domain-containing protein n=1 Tax=Equus asinus asinus TaxID=83772 RepID=A0A8C4MLZ0_EQUAS
LCYVYFTTIKEKMNIEKERLILQGRARSPEGIFSPFPGYHVSEDSRSCTPCTDGVDYTSHKNLFSSCLPCSTCKSDEERIADCTRTEDTQCRCKRGTFHGEDFPEVCQTCRSSPCTPWSDLKCVHQGSGTQASGEAPVPGEPPCLGSRERMGSAPGVCCVLVGCAKYLLTQHWISSHFLVCESEAQDCLFRVQVPHLRSLVLP